ncbi:MAG: energy transducer TonB [Terriglobales bacterium]|jgi:TonB family protein
MIVMIVACCAAVALSQNSAPPAGARVRVSNEVMLGLVQHKTMPVYPEEAMSKGIQGDVIFKIEVDDTGKITSSVPVSGDPVLVNASKEALKTFSFRPYLLNGTPVKIETQLGFHFAVQKTADGANGHVECMTTIPDRP